MYNNNGITRSINFFYNSIFKFLNNISIDLEDAGDKETLRKLNLKNSKGLGTVWLLNLRRLYKLFIKKKYDENKYHFLDIGCGNGIPLIYAYKKFNFKSYSGFDFENKYVENSKKNLKSSINKSSEISIFYQNADNFFLNENESFFIFMFNPFNQIVMKKFLENQTGYSGKVQSLWGVPVMLLENAFSVKPAELEIIKNLEFECEDQNNLVKTSINKHLFNEKIELADVRDQMNHYACKFIDEIICVDNDFERLTYTQAFQILRNSKPNKKKKFQFVLDEWGADLQSEHERFLVEKHFKKPVILTDYPKDIKSFYMRQNDDGTTVGAMDVLFPGIGEIIGGSAREERLDKLTQRMDEMGIPQKEMQWFLDTRMYGTVPHAGYGLGFERLVQFVTGMANIRDVIPFPRYPGSAEF